MLRFLTLAIALIPLYVMGEERQPAVSLSKPNILWLTCEDISANIGCYGDSYAATPNIDALAARGVRYSNAYATAPVCSPARSCIATGVYAGSLGTQHLRRSVQIPPYMRCMSEYLRKVGYYCTNNSKQDYQFATPKETWDESSKKAHWKNKPEGNPFFAIFNDTRTHQSKTRHIGDSLTKVNSALPEHLRHDPADAPLPPYYPDTPIIRENVAAYYNQITIMDQTVGEHLKALEDAGLADNTIVFFYSDHGGGIPRGKRWLHYNGIHVPFIAYFPEKYRHLAPGKPGSTCDQLISFADLAPTILSILDLPIPEHIQGTPFLGDNAEPQDVIFSSRDRVDEVLLCSRTVIDGKYQYIRNFMPHRPRMPLSEYSERTPIRQEIRRLERAGTLTGPQAWLAAPTTPAEELYDIAADPHEMNNLATSEAHQAILKTLRKALCNKMVDIRDAGLWPESQLYGLGATPAYEITRSVPGTAYKAILNAAMLVGADSLDRQAKLLASPAPLIRYWAVTGILAHGSLGEESEEICAALPSLLQDEIPATRITAAEILCRQAQSKAALDLLLKELESPNPWTRLEAASAIQYCGEHAAPARSAIQALQQSKRIGKAGADRYTRSALTHILNGLDKVAPRK